MSSVRCKICRSETTPTFRAQVLRKYEVQYFVCPSCGFIQTEDPYWIEEAYQNALNLTDTGLLARNEVNRARTACVLNAFFRGDAKYLDYGGGYGAFTRMMRDIGYDFYWEDAYAQNLMARGFEHQEGSRYEALTVFEVFEHLVDPWSEFDKMLQRSDTIIFSTLLVNGVPPIDWWYYGLNHGQHVSLFSLKSLQIFAEKHGLNVYSNRGDFHMISSKKISPLYFRLICKLSTRGLYAMVKKKRDSLVEKDLQRLMP